jgi:hypothetical protein
MRVTSEFAPTRHRLVSDARAAMTLLSLVMVGCGGDDGGSPDRIYCRSNFRRPPRDWPSGFEPARRLVSMKSRPKSCSAASAL